MQKEETPWWWEKHCLTAYMHGVPASSIHPLIAESASRERSRIKEEVEKMKVAYEKEYDYWPARALHMACDDFLALLTET